MRGRDRVRALRVGQERATGRRARATGRRGDPRRPGRLRPGLVPAAEIGVEPDCRSSISKPACEFPPQDPEAVITERLQVGRLEFVATTRSRPVPAGRLSYGS